MNMGQAASEQAEKYARMEQERGSECQAPGPEGERCTLQRGHDGKHWGYMWRWASPGGAHRRGGRR